MRLDIRVSKTEEIPIRLHLSVIAFLGLVAWQLAMHHLPEAYPGYDVSWYWAVAIGTGLGLLLSIFLHTAAHLAVAWRCRMPVRQVVLYPFGDLTRPATPAERAQEIVFSLSGPAASLVAALLLSVSGNLLAEPVLLWLAAFNAGLGLFNLLPLEPLDAAGLLRFWQPAFAGSFSFSSAGFWTGWISTAILMWSGGLLLLLGRYPVDGLLFILVALALQNGLDRLERVPDGLQEKRPSPPSAVGDLVARAAPPEGGFVAGGSSAPGRTPEQPPSSFFKTDDGNDGAFLNITAGSSPLPQLIAVDASLDTALRQLEEGEHTTLLVVDNHCIVGTCSWEDISGHLARSDEQP